MARKSAANAVAQKSVRQTQSGAAKARAKAAASAPAAQAHTVSDAELNDATNKAYYALVQQDLETIFGEYGKDLANSSALPIGCGQESGVQDIYDRQKGILSLKQHSVYRCSVSAFWIAALSSATPGIPMSRKRVEDLSAYHFPNSEPKFMTDRMIEIGCSEADLTDQPRNLQMVSPEELLHSLLHACASAIKSLIVLNKSYSFLSILHPLNIGQKKLVTANAGARQHWILQCGLKRKLNGSRSC